MSENTIEDKVDSRITDEYTDPDKERPPVSERAKEVLGHNLIDPSYEGVER
jgi:hypothetical protein